MSRVRGQRTGEIPYDQCVVIGANIRALRLSRGWTQRTLGEQMGWAAQSTVCGAEGQRGDRQRRFTMDELARFATIFGVPVWRLMTRCANCGGRPPAGFACLSCGAAYDAGGTPVTANGAHPRHGAETGALRAGTGCSR